MVTFLFWNLNRQPRQEAIGRLVARHNVDVRILAEDAISEYVVLESIHRESGHRFQQPMSESRRIDIFTHFPQSAVTAVLDDHSRPVTVRRLIGRSQDILLAAVHFPSKLNWSDDDQSQAATDLSSDIRDAEAEYGHRRTVLVGDFNMNPFEVGITAAQSLHAVMTKDIALRMSRVVGGREHPFFYNPMWGFFGDRTTGPPGTYYYAGATPVSYFWNIFDQVLIRPELLDCFRDDVEILVDDGQKSLLNHRGLPDRENGSDHLPICFRLEL